MLVLVQAFFFAGLPVSSFGSQNQRGPSKTALGASKLKKAKVGSA
jgi:hypothetical protein